MYLPFPVIFNGAFPTLPANLSVPATSEVGVNVIVPIMSPVDSAVKGLVTSQVAPVIWVPPER